jgi:SAM-dependent methyltransferase
LISKGAFKVSVGSSWTKLADVNIDIRKEMRPDIVGDALNLPLRSDVADEVLFTDVIEHLPAGTEARALREIHRILRDGGTVVISTPSGRTIFKLLDPSLYFEGHRHYSSEKLVDMVSKPVLSAQHTSNRGLSQQCCPGSGTSFWFIPTDGCSTSTCQMLPERSTESSSESIDPMEKGAIRYLS